MNTIIIFLTLFSLLLQSNIVELERVTEVTSIGEHFLSGIRNVQIIDDKLIVANGDQQQIIIADVNGNYLHSFGRSGSGPGEFRSLNQLTANAQSKTIYVWDQNLARLSSFDLSGTHLESIQVPGRFMGIVANGNSSIFASVLDLAGGSKLVKQIKMDNGAVGEFVESDQLTVQVHRSGNVGGIAYSNKSNIIYYGYAYPYKIIGIDEQEKKTFTFESNHPEFTLPEESKNSGGMILGGNLKSRISSVLPVEGQIWVQYQTPSGNFVDIISKVDAKIIQTITFSENHRLGDYKDGFLYTYTVGRDAIPKIVKWKVSNL